MDPDDQVADDQVADGLDADDRGHGDAPVAAEELDALEARIDAWLRAEQRRNPLVAAIDRGEPGERRWYVRLLGEAKDVTTIWLTLRQRMLHYETYVMPAPEENHARLYEHLLRRNRGLVGVQFCIGDEDAVFLAGALPVRALTGGRLAPECDRIVGTVYATVEQCFRPALHIGFASRFGG
jgi:hypothetical protein